MNNAITLSTIDRDRIIKETIYKNAYDSGAGVKYTRIPLYLLEVPSFQRPEQRNVKRIAENWDESKCGAITVSYIEGRFYVTDGQNRLAAARLIGKEDIYCMIVQETYEESARRFAAQDENKVKVSRYSKFLALKEANDKVAMGIYDVCQRMQIRLDPDVQSAQDRLRCMSEVEKIYLIGGPEGLMWVFETIDKLKWRYSIGAYKSPIISGLGSVYEKFSPCAGAAQNIIVSDMKQYNPEGFMRKFNAFNDNAFKRQVKNYLYDLVMKNLCAHNGAEEVG